MGEMNIAEIRDEALKLLGANCILALYDCCSEAFNEIDRLEKENAEYKEVNEEWETFNISKRRAATVEQRTKEAICNHLIKEGVIKIAPVVLMEIINSAGRNG